MHIFFICPSFVGSFLVFYYEVFFVFLREKKLYVSINLQLGKYMLLVILKIV